MTLNRSRGPESLKTVGLIALLEKTSRKSKSRVWAVVAEFLKKPARAKKDKAVNLFKLERISKDGDVVVIPGVLLGTGVLKKKITVSAVRASKSAVAKLGANLVSLESLVQKNPEGKKVKIVI